ncbi:hypothetical protein PG996_009900 [Apiospora saccharicola]|uniref:Uncharacterized protein n=1 Tax=Apiospora saccharicola TaxID=335842 RepID=A0ABR1UM15_9PEZI
MAGTSNTLSNNSSNSKEGRANDVNKYQMDKYLNTSPTTVERLSCSTDPQASTQQTHEDITSKKLADWQQKWDAAST